MQQNALLEKTVFMLPLRLEARPSCWDIYHNSAAVVLEMIPRNR
jgi:hypothetical protein